MNRLIAMWPTTCVLAILIGFVFVWANSHQTPVSLEPSAPTIEPSLGECLDATDQCASLLKRRAPFADYASAIAEFRSHLDRLPPSETASTLRAVYPTLVRFGGLLWEQEQIDTGDIDWKSAGESFHNQVARLRTMAPPSR